MPSIMQPSEKPSLTEKLRGYSGVRDLPEAEVLGAPLPFAGPIGKRRRNEDVSRDRREMGFTENDMRRLQNKERSYHQQKQDRFQEWVDKENAQFQADKPKPSMRIVK